VPTATGKTTLTCPQRIHAHLIALGAPLQIIDLPGIIEGAKDGRGRGRQVIAVAKTCHLIFIVLDVNKPLTDKRVIEQELEGFGIRINKSPPNITVKKDAPPDAKEWEGKPDKIKDFDPEPGTGD
jgi:small GTP-binding protein